MDWAAFLAGLIKFLNTALPWLAAWFAFRSGVNSERKAQELESAKKQIEYRDIELAPRDDRKRLEDGTW